MPFSRGGFSNLSYGCSSAVEGAHIIKASAGVLTNIYMASTASYLMVFDATTVPADGTVAPVICLLNSGNNFPGIDFKNYPAYFAAGIVVVCSSTGPFTKTESATAYFNWEAE